MRTRFKDKVRAAIADPVLQSALDANAERRMRGWKTAFASLPDFREQIQRAHQMRQSTLASLEDNLEEFIRQVTANGIQVHHAATAHQACDTILAIIREHKGELVTKSKSMLSEEIGLNEALQSQGIEVVETDLGEFIVQLRGESPSHIITPAVHLRREDVAQSFADQLGMPYTTDVKKMTQVARKHLREIFLHADVGISGVNFGVAESGTLCVITNEGNGRLVTSLPPVHIAIMGMERLVPTFEDLGLMLNLLPRAATGQKLTSYVNLINRPRGERDPDGPTERHLVLVDNGRTSLAKGPLSEALFCIRCGACLNACPVYREVGGHSYESVYPGPIGSLLSPSLFGIQEYGHLAKASTLCGLCQEVCPVGIDIPALLLRLRGEYTKSVSQPLLMKLSMKIYAWLASRPQTFQLSQRIASILTSLLPKKEGWLHFKAPPLNMWTRSRDFPPVASKPFHKRIQEREPISRTKTHFRHPTKAPSVETPTRKQREKDRFELFRETLVELGGEVIACRQDELPDQIAAKLKDFNVERLQVWGSEDEILQSTLAHLEHEGMQILKDQIPEKFGPARKKVLGALADAQAGLTSAQAALAMTGSLVIPGGPGRPQTASLLPPLHIAVISRSDIFRSFDAWLARGGKETLINSPSVTLISGPSRTADIEMTLSTGVHGPEQVIVFCLES